MLTQYMVIGDDTVRIPQKLRVEGKDDEGRSYEDWLLAQMQERGLIEFDPRELNADEAKERLRPNTSRHLAGLIRELEDRKTVIEAAAVTDEDNEEPQEAEEEPAAEAE